MAPLEATFVGPTTVQLRSGQRIAEIAHHTMPDGSLFMTGWLVGVLYVSRDQGTTWQPSDLTFRSA